MSDQEQPRRGKLSQSTAPAKKGKSSWKPASVMDVVDKDPDKRYRLVNKDPDNIAKKKAEGWDFVTKGTSGDEAELLRDDKSGKPLTSVYEKRDVILMSMPEETAKERDAYMENKTERRTMGLTAHFKKEARAAGTQAHGDITISSLRGQKNID